MTSRTPPAIISVYKLQMETHSIFCPIRYSITKETLYESKDILGDHCRNSDCKSDGMQERGIRRGSKGNRPSETPELINPTAESKIPAYTFWDDIVELVNRAGDTTTAYKLDDGRYLDRMDRFFEYDGIETWLCSDGSEWNRTLEDTIKEPATNVHAEFVIERFLAQRPDHKLFSDAPDSAYASRILLSFDTTITNFRFLKLEGTFSETGLFVCTDFEELYFEPELTVNDLMVVETELDGLIPSRGISFVDAAGNTQYYYLALSGEDNVPLVVPFG